MNLFCLNENRNVSSHRESNAKQTYPYKDKKRGYTVTRHTEMKNTKPEQNATNGIKTTVAKQKQQEAVISLYSGHIWLRGV